ncbi:aldose epimerase family protein [Lapidilactobacillus luobeiensis]|uniref:aldose epimerase family protein n=1 Tax=Lapidilactobacillus luobeiensis TaxID=2950371 RepID=UPI0021C3678B|nr:aldose epimerase family protein [Lapidilactobacillus luobeiensis]
MITNKTLFDTVNGEPVYKLSLTNANKMTISCLSYGANWYELLVPTAAGPQNLLLNFAKIADYQTTNQYLNMSIGRVAGRIGKGRFKIGEHDYQVAPNERGNTLHGGPHGFNQINWDSTVVANQIIFTHQITSTDDSFPGDLDVTLTYTLTDDNQVLLDYNVLSHGETVFNPTNHAYFNLNAGDENIKNLELLLKSSHRLALDTEKIPTGKTLVNTDTPYGFETKKTLGAAIEGLQNIPEKGIDDVYLIDRHADNDPVAVLSDPDSNISVSIFSQRNAIVLFTANGFGPDQPYLTKTGQPYVGVALEAQTAPNAIFDHDYGDFSLQDGERQHYQTKYQIRF